ncbi:hypothetical protein AAFC00_004771 [Neodothiora populina]|uniref:Calcium uniporter protein, mitochondrial n=1 Tax=Neodothiora populina TaxID=2781224 RepID=A0ABR3P3E0_9PEZI
MKPLISGTLFGPAGSRARQQLVSALLDDTYTTCIPHGSGYFSERSRAFATCSRRSLQKKEDLDHRVGANAQPAHKVSQNVSKEEKLHYEEVLEHSKESQMRSPWMHEGSDKPPVARQRSAGAMTKGKLLTTPSRMLKLILPLSTKDVNKDRKDLEPLALLVHPQQPLSYLERLIQSELPVLKDDQGHEKIPAVHFRAEDLGEDGISAEKKSPDENDDPQHEDNVENADETTIDGKVERTGKISGSKNKSEDKSEAEPAVEQPPQEEPSQKQLGHRQYFVRWSPSTEIGDFIRDAARGKEFSIEIEGAPTPIFIAVPSFKDRTYYLRLRLRKTAKQIASLADIKTECDNLAHRGAQRVAQGGFAILVGWWYLVYRLTFETELGWDVMEPVTYLVGLSTLIGGYMWFLYHNREVSYRSAMNFTISRRQSKLYEQRGFDLGKWESLMEEGNRLRREIKMVADEYDVDWDERLEEGDDKVAEALRNERKKNNGKEEEDDEDDDDKKSKKKADK